MPDSALSRIGTSAEARQPRSQALCLETQGREIVAVLVHDVVAEAMTLNLYGKPAVRVEEANGAHLERGRGRKPNG